MKEALLFLKKKQQKNFYFPRDLVTPLQTPAVNRSFLVLFFKKERLACDSSHHQELAFTSPFFPVAGLGNGAFV